MSFFKRKTVKVYPARLIVGLGNPGAEYRGTRHNVGFDVIDRIAKDHKIDLKTNQHNASFGVGQIAGVDVALVKPLTFMNLSGRSVAALSRHFNIKPTEILVIADDLDLPTGQVRMRAKGSAGGHNGHKSLIELLHTNEYPRLKIGIGKGGDQTIDHVLSKFHPDERSLIEEAIKLAADSAELWLSHGLDGAIAHANRAGKRLDE